MFVKNLFNNIKDIVKVSLLLSVNVLIVDTKQEFAYLNKLLVFGFGYGINVF